MKIAIINGPNLNLLGTREPNVYGKQSLGDINEDLSVAFPNVNLQFHQSNLEGEIITWIQELEVDGIVLNAGGYTHTSVAIRDAIATVKTPVVEVHLSNVSAREAFRHESLLSPVCAGCIFGFGAQGYHLAVQYYVNRH